MDIKDLTGEQLAQVKIDYLAEKQGGNVSYMQMANIDALITDAEIFNAFSGVDFVADDFTSYEPYKKICWYYDPETERYTTRILDEFNHVLYADFYETRKERDAAINDYKNIYPTAYICEITSEQGINE